MENIIEAEYTLQERTLPVIAGEIKVIEEHVYNTTLAGVIQIGARLTEAKDLCEHGSWTDWCQKNLGYSQRQAQRYIEISEKYGDENSPFLKTTTWSNLSISKAYRLLSLPEEEVETFAEEHNVEEMTVKELEEQIKRVKAENCRLNMDNQKVKDLEKEIAKLKEENNHNDNSELIEEKEIEIKKLKEKLKTAKDQATKEQEKIIEAEVTKAKEEAKKEAEAGNKETLAKYAEAQATIENLKKNLKQNDNQEIAAFKVNAALLQTIFNTCLENINKVKETDQDQADKMFNALNLILNSMGKKTN